MQLSEMQRFLAEVYPNSDVSLQFMVNRIVANAGIIATNHKEGEFADDPFVEIVSWCIAVFSKGRKSFWEEILLRYPDACYKCLEKVCLCHDRGAAPINVEIWRATEERAARGQAIINAINGGNYASTSVVLPYIPAPPTLDQVSQMLSRIYRRNDIQYKYGKDSFFVDLLRCVGRLAAAVSKNDQDASRAGVTDHILSTFAWVLEYWRLSSKPQRSFSPTAAFLKRYKLGCPICSRKPCNCGDNRFNRLASFDIVAAHTATNDPRVEFRAQLIQLNALLNQQQIDEIPEDLPQDDRKNILSVLEDKRRALEEVGKSTEAAASIGKRISQLAAWVQETWPF